MYRIGLVRRRSYCVAEEVTICDTLTACSLIPGSGVGMKYEAVEKRVATQLPKLQTSNILLDAHEAYERNFRLAALARER